MSWTPTPVGYLSLTLEGLAEMVANSEAFQTACGLTAPDASAQDKLIFGIGSTKRIYLLAIENILQGDSDTDPLLDLPKVFMAATKAVSVADSGGSSIDLIPDSREYVITLVTAAIDDTDQNLERSYLTHLNLVGVMEREINAQAGSNDLPATHRITLENVGSLSPFEEAASTGRDYWISQWLLSTGV